MGDGGEARVLDAAFRLVHDLVRVLGVATQGQFPAASFPVTSEGQLHFVAIAFGLRGRQHRVDDHAGKLREKLLYSFALAVKLSGIGNAQGLAAAATSEVATVGEDDSAQESARSATRVGKSG